MEQFRGNFVKIFLRIMLIWLIHPVLAGDIHETSPLLDNDNQNSSLTVALYPFITDVNRDGNAHLLSIMKQYFQQINPSINLTLYINQKYDCYNLSNLPDIFSKSGPQLVEVDLSLLGYLVDNGYLTPYNNRSLEKDILPSALTAGRYQEKSYAIPTYVCSQFLFSRDQAILDIHNVTDLSTIFRPHSSEFNQMLTGEFQGGGMWMLPMLYVFAYIDNSEYKKKNEAVYGPVNRSAIATMAQTMNWCSVNGTNNCLNGYYYSHSPTIVFARNEAYSYNGFSENLYNIRKTDPDTPLYLIPTPYGNNQNPLIWVDGLVINRNSCDDQCMEKAGQFVTFYNSLPVKNLIAFSEDAFVPSPPRYILPSTQDFYQTEHTRADRYYMGFFNTVKSAESYPNSGIVENLNLRYQEICGIVKENIPNTMCFCGNEDFGMKID